MSKADYKNYSSDYNAYRLKLIDGVIHEGRHAYQDYMIKHPEKCPEEDRDKLTLWKENMHDAVDLSGELQRVYLNPEEKGKGVYRYQPVEDDAWEFAKEQMNSIFSRTSEHDQYLYNQYREELNRKDADWALEAQNIVGLNYKQEIEKLVHDRYLNIIMEHAHSSIAKQYSSLVVDVESHNGFTTYCAANTAKSVDFDGHADPSQTIIAANNRDGLRDCDIAAGKINSDNYWLRNGLSLDGRVPDHAKRVESLTQTKQNEGGVSQQPSSGFDFHKALAAHIKSNEEMYAQLDAQRGGQNQQTQQSLPMQPKDNSGLAR